MRGGGARSCVPERHGQNLHGLGAVLGGVLDDGATPVGADLLVGKQGGKEGVCEGGHGVAPLEALAQGVWPAAEHDGGPCVGDSGEGGVGEGEEEDGREMGPEVVQGVLLEEEVEGEGQLLHMQPLQQGASLDPLCVLQQQGKQAEREGGEQKRPENKSGSCKK